MKKISKMKIKFIFVLSLLLFIFPNSIYADTQTAVLYSTDYKIVIGNYCDYGVTMINNEIYIPINILPCTYRYGKTQDEEFRIDFTTQAYNAGGGEAGTFWIGFAAHFMSGRKVIESINENGFPYSMDYEVRMSSDGHGYGGKAIGNAYPISNKLVVVYPGEDKDEFQNDGAIAGEKLEASFENVLYTIGDAQLQYPMFNISVLKECFPNFEIDQENRIIYIDKKGSGYTEENLAAARMETFFNNDTSPREKVIAIHNYILDNIKYPNKISWLEYEQKAMDALEAAGKKYNIRNNVTLSSGYGICEDYAALFKQMCRLGGIICIRVGNEEHAWNEVYIEGRWYVVDCTLDDTGAGASKTSYLLIDRDKYTGYGGYTSSYVYDC